MTDNWYIRTKDKERGPMSADSVREALAMGEVPPDCWVWRDGLDDWVPLAAEPTFTGARDY